MKCVAYLCILLLFVTTSHATILSLNWVDDDNDGVMDFADGYDRNGIKGDADDVCPGKAFMPVYLQIDANEAANSNGYTMKLSYSASDPLGAWTNGAGEYFPAAGSMRLWAKDGGERRNGHATTNGGSWVAPGEYTPWQLGFRGNRVVTNYLEAVNPGSFGISLVPIPAAALTNVLPEARESKSDGVSTNTRSNTK